MFILKWLTLFNDWNIIITIHDNLIILFQFIDASIILYIEIASHLLYQIIIDFLRQHLKTISKPEAFTFE